MSDKPDPGRALREEKQRMFADQAARRERAKPLHDKNQAGFARALLARLDQISASTPTRIVLNGPPAGAMTDPIVRSPERIGGCFSDIHDDQARNEGAHEKEIETEEAAIEEDDEVPFG